MITVYRWHEQPLPPPGNTAEVCVVPDRPEVNANGPVARTDEIHQWICDSWNRQYPGEPKAFADFEFVDKPEGWENPNP